MLNPFLDKFVFTGALKYKHSNFFLVNIPFVIVPTELMVGLAAMENDDLNKEVYYAFKKATEEKLLKQFGVDFGLQGEKAVKLVEDFIEASGWGHLQPQDFDSAKKRAIITVANSPVASALHGKAKQPVDHFLRGVFAGLFSHTFKTEMECVEVKCSALNDKECEFVIKKAEELDFNSANTKKQVKVEF
ncbi:MAG: 4-vinyl reductase [Candidatus Diapherotrites archaeon]